MIEKSAKLPPLPAPLVEHGATVLCLCDGGAEGFVCRRGKVKRWTDAALVLDIGVVFLSRLILVERCEP
jgi:hypothetical protein